MIVADKPAESWIDQDVTRFEIELADLVRKFQNLEALQKETTAKGEGFEARRITVTHADGQETHRVVWVDNEQEKQVEQLVEEVMNVLPTDPQLQQAVLTKLTERILNADSGSNKAVTAMPSASSAIAKKRKNQGKQTSILAA